MLKRLRKRTKAALFVLCLIPMDTLAALAVVRYGRSVQLTSADLVLAATLLGVLVSCEILAAYMTFFMEVDRPSVETR